MTTRTLLRSIINHAFGDSAEAWYRDGGDTYSRVTGLIHFADAVLLVSDPGHELTLCRLCAELQESPAVPVAFGELKSSRDVWQDVDTVEWPDIALVPFLQPGDVVLSAEVTGEFPGASGGEA